MPAKSLGKGENSHSSARQVFSAACVRVYTPMVINYGLLFEDNGSNMICIFPMSNLKMEDIISIYFTLSIGYFLIALILFGIPLCRMVMIGLIAS